MPRKTSPKTKSKKQFLNDPHILVLLPNIHITTIHNGQVSLHVPTGEAMQCDWRDVEKCLVKFFNENF